MLSAIFTSVADALLSYAIDKLDPAERIKSWLRLDPARLAFEKALARAYSAFARQYPEYTASLFDQPFLSTNALPELSKLLIRDQHPDPALLAQAWGQSIGAGADFAQRATKPAAYFLERLEAELKSEPALQAVFDSRALERLPKIEADIQKLAKELQRGLDEALKVASNYQKATVHIGGNVQDSVIITGDNNQLTINKTFYSGDFISLEEYYIPPDGVFQRVRVDEFVGREWLTAKVDTFLNDPNRKSGTFLLIGDAGVGKTAFMAHLVKERRYLHLFAEQAPGQAMLQRAMQSLASQLVTCYQIDPYKDRDTLNALSVFPDFLERILRLAASTLTEGEKIVIVCDALDEAGTFPDHFVFGLPKELPDGVYFILSQRPVNVKLPNYEPVIENLEAQGEDNLQDIEAYLSAVAKRPEIAGQIRSKEYSEEFFIQTLRDKSQGVWMYLHYIIKEIESGARAPLDLANLPTGLVGYYAEYWDAWRTGKRGKGEEAWDELYAPLLTTLAAAQEAIPVDWLIRWADVTAKPREVTRLLTEHWRAFITEKGVDGKKAYTPYHLSFKDFITGKVDTGKVDTGKLQTAQANLVKELAAQTVDAHKRIANAFEKECNGEWEKLVEQEYPRLHLTTHLNGAGEHEKLRILLTEGDEKVKWAEAREKKDENYTGYLNDLLYIWDYAEREQNYALAIRCMLIENSIHSFAGNIPPILLVELGKNSLWSYSKCLSIIREKTNGFEKSISLKLLAPYLPKHFSGEALNIAFEIKDIHNLVFAISEIAPWLETKSISRSFEFAIKIESDIPRGNLLVALAPFLDKKQIEIMISIANSTPISSTRAQMLAAAAIKLNKKMGKEIIDEALEIIWAEKDDYKRQTGLISLLNHTKGEAKKKILKEFLFKAKKINNFSPYFYQFENLLPHTNGEQKRQLTKIALKSISTIPDKTARLRSIIRISPYLNKSTRNKVIKEVFEETKSIKNDVQFASLLETLAPHLNGSFQEKSLAMANEIQSEIQRANALCAFAPHILSTTLKSQFLILANQIQDKSLRAKTLSSIVPYLEAEEKIPIILKALADSKNINDESPVGDVFTHLSAQTKDEEAIRKIFFHTCQMENDFVRSNVLSRLACNLTDEFRSQAIHLTRENKTDHARARVLTALSPYLNQGDLAAGLLAAREIKEPSHRAGAMAVIISFIKNENKPALIKETLTLCKAIREQYFAKQAFSALAHQLGMEDLSLAIDAIQHIKEDWSKSNAIITLAPFLQQELISKAINITLKIKHETARAQTIKSLLPYLSKKQLSTIYSEARKIKTPTSRASLLAAISSYLPSKSKSNIIRECIDSLNELRMDHQYFRELEENLKLFPRQIKTQILSEVLMIKDKNTLSIAIPAIAEHFNKSQIKRALETADDFDITVQRARIQMALLPYLDNSTRKGVAQEALVCVRKNERNINSTRLRSEIAIFLPGKMRSQIFKEELLSTYYYPIDKLMAQWEKFNYAGLQESIINLFKIRAKQDRKDGLAVITNLLPALVKFSNNKISDDILSTLLDVTRWWP